MDVPEADFDIKLQRISGDLISEIDKSLPSLLRKPDSAGALRVRSRVRAREVDRLTGSVCHFLRDFASAFPYNMCHALNTNAVLL